MNTNLAGAYIVTYNVSDAADNAAAEVTRTVNVTADATAPVITLLGSSPVDVELGSTYTDAGATASDNIDGDISANIVTVNPVNTNLAGTYIVTYNVSDAADNAAAEVTRTVNVTATADTTPPVITLLGSTPVDVELGSTYTDAGATASDNIDGDISANIVTVNPVNTNLAGAYIVTYNVSDAADNAAAEVTRTVNVTADATAPVITLLGSSPVDVELGSTYTDAGATASDNIDGDISANIVTVNPVNTNLAGAYIVTYNVSDAADNAAAEVTRTVNVTADATAPVITLLGSSPVDVELGSTYTDAGATASDNIDGDISANIVTVNPVNTNLAGTYIVTYNVSDAADNAAAEVTRTVNVTATADTTPPVITLLGSTPVDVELGSTYTDAGATASDNIDGDISANIVTVNPVNTNLAGAYIVTYNVSDAADNAAAEVTRTVNVTANVPPTADAGGPYSGMVGDAVSFNGSGSADSDGSIVSYDWDFGDGNTGTGVSTSHTYASDATFTVTLTVTDNAGDSDTNTTTAMIQPDTLPPPSTVIIDEAKWESGDSRLVVKGVKANQGETVIITNADTDERIGTTRVPKGGEWKFEQEIGQSPCRVRATIGIKYDEENVKNAPSNCDDGTGSPPGTFLIDETKWESGDSRLVVKGVKANRGEKVIITNANTGEMIGSTRAKKSGEWKFERELEPAPCRVRATVDKQFDEKDVKNAPSNCSR